MCLGDTVTATGIGSVTVTNPGNIRSPCQLQVSNVSGSTCLITATGYSLTIGSITSADEIFEIDGIAGTIAERSGKTEGGWNDVDLWELPYMTPGKNVFRTTPATANIKATVQPVYM